jgi:thiol-disulfide isomerase/thioredoxin
MIRSGKWIVPFLLALVLGVAGSGAGQRAAADSSSQLLSFDGNTGWINSPPLTPASLRGKVVLVDFWEYTCINCLRTLPYLRTWYDRYHDMGFVIVGVHTNEFDFSGETPNINAAVKQLNINWPVVMDTNNAIAKRYSFTGWPEELLYDQNGQLQETQNGEGNYPQTEAKIQELLKASNPTAHFPAVMALLPQDSYDKPGAVCYPQTPETFVGPWHGPTIANASAFNQGGGDANYVDNATAATDQGKLYLSGYWHPSNDGQAMISGGNNGYIRLGYQAIQVVVVMKPENGQTTRVTVTEDGKPVPKDDAGSDLQYDANGNSYVSVDAARAYNVIMNKTFGQHDLRLAPDRFGLGVYSFAFESCQVPG